MQVDEDTIESRIQVSDAEEGSYSLISENERDEIFAQWGNLEALEDFMFSERRTYHVRDLFDYLNHSYHLMLDFADKDVFTIGVGEGTEAIFFALYGARHVFGLDKNPHRISTLNKSAESYDLESKISTLVGDYTTAAIRPSCFDIVTMIGVLEWLPNTSSAGAEQVQYLKKAHQALKPDGTLVLGIESRMNPIYFLGRTNHGDIPFTPLLPRVLANTITMLFRNKPYTTFTYTNSGYRKLLARAGFSTVDIYPVLFSYQEPRFIFATSKGLREVLRKFGVQPVYDMGALLLSALPSWLLLKLVPSYIIIARK